MSEKAQPKKPQRLICSCCGKFTRGRQWYNRDKGYGLCPDCHKWLIESGEPSESVEQSYGKFDVHILPEPEARVGQI